MVVVNPMSPLDAIYTDKARPPELAMKPLSLISFPSLPQVSQMFVECRVDEMPPHIFSVAAAAHRSVVTTRKDQSIVLVGRSGV